MTRQIVSALLAILVACCALAADDPGAAARQLGGYGNTQAATATSADPRTYPGYQGADVPERDYYRSGTQIETQARMAAPDSSAGTVVTTNVLSGPRFYFQSSDPLLQNTANAQSAGASLLTQRYQGCSSLTVGGNSSRATPATCYAHALQASQSCSRTLSTSCEPGTSNTAGNTPDCSVNDHWTQHCESGTEPAPTCTLQSSVCTEGPGTRTVNGVPQYRACWAYQDTYLCGSPQQQEEAACTTLRNQGCQQTASTCVAQDAAGHCTRYQQSFQCPSASAPTQSVTLCGSDLYCLNGSCTSDVVAPAVSDAMQMAAASTWLQAAQQAGLDNTNATGTFSFFAGDGMKCSKEALGFSNCCSDSGWGNDAGLAQCSEEEQQLGLAREAKRTHYVGDYETGSIFTTTHESYCVFNGLLSRLIQEQGRAQLGINWGSARDPDCRALTPDEISRLDLNAMDFSEFYAQAQAQADAGLAARESNAAIQQRLQQQIDAMAGGQAK